MRLIDADTLMEKVERIQPWDAYLGKYAQGIRHCMEIVSLLIKDAPTIESSAQPEITYCRECANRPECPWTRTEEDYCSRAQKRRNNE